MTSEPSGAINHRLSPAPDCFENTMYFSGSGVGVLVGSGVGLGSGVSVGGIGVGDGGTGVAVGGGGGGVSVGGGSVGWAQLASSRPISNNRITRYFFMVISPSPFKKRT